MDRLRNSVCLLGILVLGTPCFGASNQNLVYQGRVVRPDGTVPNTGSLTFTLSVYSPSPSKCLLYSETQIVSMVGSQGMFSLQLGAGSRVDGGSHTLNQVFTNGATLSGLTCASGSSYTAGATDDRSLAVSFNDAGTVVNLSAMAIKSVPFALQAHEVDGWGLNNLVKVSSIGSPSTFTTSEMANVKSVGAAACATNEILKWNGSAWACSADATGGSPADAGYTGSKGIVAFDTDAATSGITVASGIAKLSNTGVSAATYGTASKVASVSVNAQGRVTSASEISISIPASQITQSGAAVGEVLKWNGSGWLPATDATGTSPGDATYAAKGLVQADTDAATSGLNLASGVISVNTGTGANQIVKLDASSKLPAVDGSALTNLSASQISAGTLPVSRGGTGSAAALTNNKVMVSSGGAIVEGVGFGSSNTASTFVTRDASGNFAAGTGTFDSLKMNGSVSGTLTFTVPSSFTSYSLNWPTADGSAGQFLKTDGSGNLSWASASSVAITSLNGSTVSTQTFATPGTSGTAPDWSTNTGTGVHTLNIPMASTASVTAGLISKTDYDAFNNKLATSTSFSGDVSGAYNATSVDKIKGTALSISSLTSGDFLRYNGSAWVNSVLSSGDITTALGYTPVNRAGDTMSGALSLGGNNISNVNQLSLKDSGSNTVTLKAPTTVGANYSLVLPTADGSAGQFLKTDGAGNLSWATSATPGDATYAAKGIVQFDTDAATSGITVASGVASVNAGTGANQIVKLDGTSKLPAVDGSALTNLNANNIASGTLPIAHGGTGASTKTAAFDALSPLTTKGDVLVFDGTNNIRLPAGSNGQVLTADSAQASGVKWAAASTGTVTSVTGGTGLTGGTITSVGTLAVDVGTGANQIVQLDASSKLPAVDGSALTNLNANNIASGTLPVSRGGTGASTFAANNLVGTNGTGTALQAVTCAQNQIISFDASGNYGCYNLSSIAGGTYFAQNGNSFGAAAVLGTNDNNSLSFETNNSTRLTIDTSGNVGIGTSNPGAPLDVKGEVRMTGATSGYAGFKSPAVGPSVTWTLPTADGSAGQFLKTDGAGNLSWATSATPGDATYAAKGIVQFDTDAATSGITVASGVASVNAGTGANQIVKLDGTSKLPAVDGSALTNLNANNIASGTLPIARGGTGASTKTAAFDALSPLTTKGDVIVFDGTNNIRLPAGSNGQVLTADSAQASGVKWAAASTGTVTSITGGTGLTGGTITSVGTLAVDVGTGANQIVQLDASSKLPAVDGSALTGLNADNVASGTLPVSRGGTGSGTALTNNKVMVSSGGAIVEGSGFASTNTASTFVTRDSSGNFAAGAITNNSNILKGATSGTLTMTVPATVTSYSLVWPATDGSAGQFLKTDGAGNLSWASASSVAITSLNGSTVSTQTFATPGTSGTAPDWSTNTGTGVHTLNIPMASTASVTAGLISKTDYDAFNNKLGTGTSFSGDVSGAYNATSVDKIKGTAVSVSSLTSGDFLRYNGSAWVNSVLSSGDITTALGYTPVNRAGDTMSGALNLNGNNISNVNQLSLKDSGMNTVTLKAPTTVGANYSLVLPTADGSAGQFLKTDGSGNLSWATSATPGDATYAAKGIVQFDTDAATSGITLASGVASVNAGTGANQIVKLDGTSKLPAVDGSALTNLNANNIASGTLPIARGGTGASTKTAAFDALSPLTTKGDVIVFDGTNNIRLPAGSNGQVLTADSAQASGVKWAAASTGTVTSVTGGTGLTGGTITSVGTLAVDVGTGANQIVQLDGSSKMPAVDGSALTNLSAANISSGTLPVSRGGTGASSFAANNLIGTNGTGTALQAVTCTQNQIISFDASGNYGCYNLSTIAGGTYFANGGNSFGSGASLGTNDANALSIKTNNAVRMTLSSGGSVGIGTSNPGGLLTVEKASNASTEMQISTPGISGNQDAYLSIVTKSNSSWLGQAANKGWTFGARGDAFSTAALQNDLFLNYWNGTSYTNAIAVDSLTGNVGIGTTNPGAPLDVKGEIRMTGATSGYAGFKSPAVGPSVTWTLPTADGSAGQFLKTDGSGNLSWASAAAGGITSLNGLSASSQTFAIGTSGTAPAFSSATSTHTLNIPMASTASVTAGLISKTDYDTFNSKLGTSTSFSGDVSGAYNATSVDKIKGTAVSISSLTSGNYLKYNGSAWVNSALSVNASTDITAGTLPVSRGGTGASSLTANNLIGTNGTGTALQAVTCTQNQVISFDASGNYGCYNLSTIAGSTYFTQNGNSFAAAAVLGTNDNNKLSFETNNSTRMTIDTSGNVGIGTMSPTHKVHVVGDLNAVFLEPATSTNSTAVYMMNAGNASEFGIEDSAGGTLLNGSSAYASVFGTQSIRSFQIGTSNTVRMTIDGSGKVGIGTTSPSSPLDVEAAAQPITATNGQVVINSTDSQAINKGGMLTLGGNDGSTQRAFANVAGFKENGTSGNYAGYLAFATRANGSAPAERMRIDSAGNVGIGITSPAYKLDVLNTGLTANNFYDVARFAESNTGKGPVLGYVANGTGTAISGSYLYTMLGDLWLGTNGAQQAMTIQATTSNVGIGTTSPSEKLHVNGNAKVTGTFQAAAEKVQTSVNSGTAVTLGAVSSGNIYRVTMTGNATVTLPSDPGVSNGMAQVVVVITQDATGGRTLTWGAPAGDSIVWNQNTTPTVCSGVSEKSIYQFMKINGDSNWYAAQVWKQCP